MSAVHHISGVCTVMRVMHQNRGVMQCYGNIELALKDAELTVGVTRYQDSRYKITPLPANRQLV